MGYAKGTVLSQGELFRYGGGRIQNQKTSARSEHGDIDGRQILDEESGRRK